MKTKNKLEIALRIITFFGVGMLSTFISESQLCRDFFGDVACIDKACKGAFNIDVKYNWGARHYWYFWMCFIHPFFNINRIENNSNYRKILSYDLLFIQR